MKIANYKRCFPQALVALVLVGGATHAFAQGSNVSVTGSIKGECKISGGDSLTIPLGEVQASTFKAVGDHTNATGDQVITLDCSASPRLRMRMGGLQHAGTADTSVLALNGSGAGIATGVGVQLLYGINLAPSTLLRLDGDPPTITAAAGTTARVRISARYYATSATPTAGEANATATLTFLVD